MNKNRFESFSDGVIAIIITIMVLELKVPQGTSINDLLTLFPVFFSYVMSFSIVGIYWANHHHLMHTPCHITTKIIWANLVLLFFMSLIPFSTGWMGEHNFEKLPVALYCINGLLCALAYFALQNFVISGFKHSTDMIEALKKQKVKGIYTLIINIIAIPVAFYAPYLSVALILLISLMWIIPDKNIEKVLISRAGEKFDGMKS